MKKYCPVCFREISTNPYGRIYRHGFKKNRWIFSGDLEEKKYKKVDSSPCRGSGKTGLTLIQMEKEKEKERTKNGWKSR